MERNQILGMIAGYFLSRFDDRAYDYFGFTTHTKTHEKLADVLNVKANSIKNWRDEFDPVHDNARLGWHKRPMSPSRTATMLAFDNLSLEELGSSLMDAIKFGPDYSGLTKLVFAVRESAPDQNDFPYVPRGPTGRKAEEYFISCFEEGSLKITGKLQDVRDRGCGYDFQIVSEMQEFLVEVKGLAGEEGGISFTSKEWKVAGEMGDNYLVALISKVDSDSPELTLIQNPYQVLKARAYSFVKVCASYQVGATDLRTYFDS